MGLDWIYKNLSGYHAVGNMGRPERCLCLPVGQKVAVAFKKKQGRASPENRYLKAIIYAVVNTHKHRKYSFPEEI